MSWRLLVLLVLLVAAVFAGDETTTAAAPPAEPSDDVLIWGLNHNNSVLLRSILAATCVILAGMVSGLTLSIFSITKEELESMVMAPHTASRAKRLLRLHHHEHWVLVTLLVCNAASVEALPLLLEPLLDISHIVQVLVPTLLVLFFSEIIPQSIFVRYAFAVSAALIPFVMIMMVVTMPISLTVGYLLDKIVGHRSLRSFRRMELKQLVYENLARSGLLHSVGNTSSHRRSLMSRASGVGGATWGDHNATGDLTMDEARLILGALSISETRVGERMKPLGDCLWVTPETQFSPPVVEALARAGYSRIPVLNRAAGEGARPALLSKPTADERVSSIGEGRAAKTSQPTFILTKDLIRLVHHLPGSAYSTPADFAHYQTVACRVDDCVLDLYLKFLAQKRHLAIVANDDGEPVGLITYSDVIGILTQTQFLDESDLTRDLPAQVRIRRHHHHAAYSDSPGRGSTVRTTAQHSTGGSPTGRAARDSAHSSAPVGERTALLSAPHKTVSPPPSQPSTSSKRTRSNMV